MSWKKWIDPGFYELRRLKNEVVAGPYVEVNPSGYSIGVVRRGDALLYTEGGRALLVAVDLRNDKIFSASITCWDDDALVSGSEKKTILDRISSYMLNYQKVVATIV